MFVGVYLGYSGTPLRFVFARVRSCSIWTSIRQLGREMSGYNKVITTSLATSSKIMGNHPEMTLRFLLVNFLSHDLTWLEEGILADVVRFVRIQWFEILTPLMTYSGEYDVLQRSDWGHFSWNDEQWRLDKDGPCMTLWATNRTSIPYIY